MNRTDIDLTFICHLDKEETERKNVVLHNGKHLIVYCLLWSSTNIDLPASSEGLWRMFPCQTTPYSLSRPSESMSTALSHKMNRLSLVVAIWPKKIGSNGLNVFGFKYISIPLLDSNKGLFSLFRDLHTNQIVQRVREWSSILPLQNSCSERTYTAMFS